MIKNIIVLYENAIFPRTSARSVAFPALVHRAGKNAIFADDEFFSASLSNPHNRSSQMHWMVDHYSVSVRRACGYGLFSRAAWYRKSRAPDQAALRRRIREIAHSRAAVRLSADPRDAAA